MLRVPPLPFDPARAARVKETLAEHGFHSDEPLLDAVFGNSPFLGRLALRETGALPPRLAPLDRGTTAWYVLQNRPGAWASWDRALVSRGTPSYKAAKLGVPLVWIFPYRDLETAARGR